MHKKTLTYKQSGVDTSNTNKLVKYISNLSNKTKIKGSRLSGFKNIGGFGSLFDLKPHKIKNPVLVSATDGVGTKLELANKLNKFDTIGIDLVAMCVNDLIVQGARPLFFLDYIAIGKVEKNKYKKLLKGIAKGCEISKCYLAGGETAEMPGIYSKNKFDMAGFSVGIVDKSKILYGKKIQKDNLILAIPSSGLHSNGFSLVRHVLKLKKIKNKNILKKLLEPTKIYTNEVLKLHSKNLLNGCCNITGGGITENLPRVLPKGKAAVIDLDKIKTLKIFKFLKQSNISDNEMLKTFNCGVGFCLIINEKNLKKVQSFFKTKYKPYPIGKIMNSNNKKIIFNGNIKF
ncbi:phosphoribosylformylglycinamidine cyclo-ligase [Candidatus Pelagibacter sp. HIMB109]|uniref:phosphoribosylformylglycinamidine cyclo-ligase n=1 Tax=Candidatus Pelagibacter sp. HIMB109 TaxID=3415412 RepID=UPI003F85FE13